MKFNPYQCLILMKGGCNMSLFCKDSITGKDLRKVS